jgi:hypothetical protein
VHITVERCLEGRTDWSRLASLGSSIFKQVVLLMPRSHIKILLVLGFKRKQSSKLSVRRGTNHDTIPPSLGSMEHKIRMDLLYRLR